MPDLAFDLALGGAASSGTPIGFGVFASRPASGTTIGQLYFATDSPVALSIWDGTKWRPYLAPSAIGLQPPAAAGFTAFNSTGTLALADNNGAVQFTGVDDGTGAVGTLRGFQQNLPAGSTPHVEACAQFQCVDQSPTSGFATLVVGMRENGTNKAFGIMSVCSMASGATAFETDIWTSNTARTGTVRGIPSTGDSNAPMFLRVALDGAGNINALVSRDLRNWQTAGTSTVAAAFTTAPDRVFFASLGIGVKPIFNVLHYEAA